MRYREPVLLGLLAIAAVLLIDVLAHPWQEAITAGFAVALAYIVHQGSKRNGG